MGCMVGSGRARRDESKEKIGFMLQASRKAMEVDVSLLMIILLSNVQGCIIVTRSFRVDIYRYLISRSLRMS